MHWSTRRFLTSQVRYSPARLQRRGKECLGVVVADTDDRLVRHVQRAHRCQKFEHIATLIAIVACACALAATAIIFFGHAPPVFNQGLRTTELLNAALLIGLSLTIGVLLGSFFLPGLARLQRAVLLAFTTLLTLNLLLIAFDRTAISVRGSMLRDDTEVLEIVMGTVRWE